MWVQQAGGWTSAKVLLDVYGHFMPTETQGFADALTTAPDGPYTAPRPRRAASSRSRGRVTARGAKRKLEPTIRLERTACAQASPAPLGLRFATPSRWVRTPRGLDA